MTAIQQPHFINDFSKSASVKSKHLCAAPACALCFCTSQKEIARHKRGRKKSEKQARAAQAQKSSKRRRCAHRSYR